VIADAANVWLSRLADAPIEVVSDSQRTETTPGREIRMQECFAERITASLAAPGEPRGLQAEAVYVLLHERFHAHDTAPYVFPATEVAANRYAADKFRAFTARFWGPVASRLLWQALPEQWRRPQGIEGS
jgi:hypothetical protein